MLYDSAVQVVKEQHSNHQFVGYKIRMPVDATLSWDEGKKGNGSEVISSPNDYQFLLLCLI